MNENEKTIYDCDVSSSLNDLNEKVSDFKSIADNVADSYTHVLDDIMRDIKEQIIDVEEPRYDEIKNMKCCGIWNTSLRNFK